MATLNFGTLTISNNKYLFNYNAVGIGYGNLSMDAGTLSNAADAINNTGQGQINYLNGFINWIRNGQVVGLAKSGALMVFADLATVISACEAFQGGYVKEMAISDFQAKEIPYTKEIQDAQTIKAFIASNPIAAVSPTMIIASNPISNPSTKTGTNYNAPTTNAPNATSNAGDTNFAVSRKVATTTPAASSTINPIEILIAIVCALIFALLFAG